MSHQTVRLSAGPHEGPDDGACVVELASMLAGEEFSDHPGCVSPVVAAFMRGYNDAVDNRRRQELYPLAADMVGTTAPRATELLRLRLCREWTRGLYRCQLGWWFRPRYGDALFEVEALGAKAGQRAASDATDVVHRATVRLAVDMIAAGGHTPVSADTDIIRAELSRPAAIGSDPSAGPRD